MRESGLPAVAADAVAVITQELEAVYGPVCWRWLSLGLLGSYARGDASPVSDLDCYLVFHPERPDDVELERSMERFERALRESQVSVEVSCFWCTLDALQEGNLAVGRWPAYDRVGFRRDALHLLGPPVTRESVKPPSFEAVLEESIRFFAAVMVHKLDAPRLVDSLAKGDATLVAGLSSAMLTKLVLMPVRMLYLLEPSAAAMPHVSVERAVAACAASHATRPWWPLVEAALVWRKSPPRESVAREAAIAALQGSLRQLFIDVTQRYHAEAEQRGMREQLSLLEDCLLRLEQS